MGKHLILGAATRYSPEEVRWFVDSLKASGYQGDTALLVDSGNADLAEYLRKQNIQTIPVTTKPWWMPTPVFTRRLNRGRMGIIHRLLGNLDALPLPGDLRRSFQWSLLTPFHHIANLRYWSYFDYLLKHREAYDKVLIIDVRDAVFQVDPFENTPTEFLWIFSENQRVHIEADTCNRGWIEYLYGEEGLRAIGQHPVLCSGSTMGSTARMLDYFRAMVDEIARKTPLIAGAPGYDQGIHNWLYYQQRLPAAQVHASLHGAIATLQLEDSAAFRFDTQGHLLNENGSVPAILHQYDRHPALVERLGRSLNNPQAKS